MAALQQALVGIGGTAVGGNIPIISLENNSTAINRSADNGLTWDSSSYTTPSADAWRDMAYDGVNLVSVSSTNDANKYAVTSGDGGKTWTLRTLPVQALWLRVTYGNGTFVAIGRAGGSRVGAMSTDHGVTWSSITFNVSDGPAIVTDIAFNGSVFCVVGAGSGFAVTNKCQTSPDGATWTVRSMAASFVWNSICWSGVNFIAANDGSTGGDNAVQHSPTGSSWTTGTIGNSGSQGTCGGFSTSNGTTVVLFSDSGNGKGWYSTDNGASFTSFTAAAGGAQFFMPCWNGTVFCAMATTNGYWTTDGITWNAVTTGGFGSATCIGAPFLTFGTF